LILTLMYESSLPSSKWKSYLESLPKEFDTLMYWSDEELKELRGCSVLEKIGKEDAEETYRKVILSFVEKNRNVFAETDTSLEAFHRMGSLIMAYGFDLDKFKGDFDEEIDDEEMEDEEDGYKALIPLADILHGDTTMYNCEFIHDPTATLLVADKPIPANTTLTIDYSSFPRSYLLRRFGAFPAHATNHDVVEIQTGTLVDIMTLINQSASMQDRLEWLADEEILEDSFDIDVSGKIPPEMLRIIKALSVSDEVFQQYEEDNEVPKADKDHVTQGFIQQLVDKRRADYDTNIGEDEELLQKKELSKRKRLAVEVRLGEKKILKKIEEIIQSWSKQDNDEDRPRSKKQRMD